MRPHLDATDEKVRRAAVEVTVTCYSLKGDRTVKYCTNLKPALLRLLKQRFAELDGKVPKKLAIPSALPPVKRGKMLSSGSSSNHFSSPCVKSSFAPLEMSRSEQLPRDGHTGELPTAEMSACVNNDVLGASRIRMGSPFVELRDVRNDQTPTDVPNFIPSPTVASDLFRMETLMTELENA